ncbi:hypothetical protein IQ272_07260 [Chroococcidiopsidales cyanobacterium LEGE 13417]|nr:hypothetical protein [Chroococcidiopsidales cyanobacterium LEGE 13417]
MSLPIFYTSPKQVSQILLIIIIFLAIASVLTESAILFLNLSTSNGYTGRMFVLDAEANIPTLYSALTLSFCALLLAIISYIKRAEDTFYTGWKFLSGLFLFLALDEFCSIHETFIIPLRKAFNTSGFLHFAWVIPATILLIIFLLSFLKFIKALPQKTRTLFILAGATYVSGALGMELVSGYYASIHGEETVAYSILTVVEELLEMLGIVVFISALLSYIKRNVGEIRFCIRFSDNQ